MALARLAIAGYGDETEGYFWAPTGVFTRLTIWELLTVEDYAKLNAPGLARIVGPRVDPTALLGHYLVSIYTELDQDVQQFEYEEGLIAAYDQKLAQLRDWQA